METWSVSESLLTMPGENIPERLLKAAELIRLIRDMAATAPRSDRREEWTPWVKSNLHGLIDHNNYVISPESHESTKGEFLTLDICVEERRFPKRILLAGESELDDTQNRRHEIVRDFEKLLAVKSAYKLMVFSSEKNGTTNEVILNEINRGLAGYGHHLRGETYIFLDYNEDSGENGSCIAHVWQPLSNGVNKPVKMECLPPPEEGGILKLLRNPGPKD